MNRKIINKRLFIFLLILAVIFSGCHKDVEPSSETNGTNHFMRQESEASVYLVSDKIDPSAFSLSENAEGVPVITGTLVPGVTLNACILCCEDINEPGFGRVDVAVIRAFGPEDVEPLIRDEWTITSDHSDRYTHETGAEYKARHVECIDQDGEVYFIDNTYRGLFMEKTWVRYPERIPWYSSEYAWQSNDFEFMSEEDAYLLWTETLEKQGVELSSVYQVDRVPYGVFDAYYRLSLSYAIEPLPERDWTNEDDAYCFSGSQDWNGFPIISNPLGHIYNGVDLKGDEYHGTLSTEVKAVIGLDGITGMDLSYLFSLEKEGGNAPLISLWDAIQTLKEHIEHPIYESEIIYSESMNSERRIVIDQILLGYVPIRQERLGISGDSAYYMLPCWTFRMIRYGRDGSVEWNTCLVNAITNEYVLQTNWISDV